MLAGDSPEPAARAQTCRAEASGSECNDGIGAVEVTTSRELATLVEFLLGDRHRPVVALAAMKDTDMVVLPPRGVRAVIGPGPPIYVIRHESLLDGLTEALGRRLTLTVGAARVWWPGLTRMSDPLDHPLVMQMDIERADSLLEEFALRFDLSRPRVSSELRTLNELRALVERQLQRTQVELVRSEQRLRDTQVQRHREQIRAQSAEAQLHALEPGRATPGLEQLLHRLIFREWLALTQGDRREHPLGRYVLTAQLLEDVERQPDLPPERWARMCTMIATRCAPSLSGIAQQPLVKLPGGLQVERSADGAKAWRCRLDEAVPGGPCLDYWERQDGTIEFTAIGCHNGPGM